MPSGSRHKRQWSHMNSSGFCISQKYIQKQFELLNVWAEIHFDTCLLDCCFYKCCIKGWCRSCSNIFPGNGSRDIGLRSLGLVIFVIFGIGTTVAIFHFLGYLPVLFIILYNSVKTSANSVKSIFQILLVIRRMPLDL